MAHTHRLVSPQDFSHRVFGGVLQDKYLQMIEEELHQDPKKQLIKGECYEILISDQLA
jgi:hypothetical protein